VAEIAEQMFVDTFVAQPPVEGLDEAVLGGLAGCDVVPFVYLPLNWAEQKAVLGLPAKF
jgi:hypothetical protein